MREIITLRRLFFSFLGFMRLATGLPVGPIVAVNGSNDAPWWPLRPFYGFVNKKNNGKKCDDYSLIILTLVDKSAYQHLTMIQ